MFEANNKSRRKQLPVATNEMGKLQPQAIEMEEAVLGSVLLESEAFDTISTICKVEHFYKEQNGLIYKAIFVTITSSFICFWRGHIVWL